MPYGCMNILGMNLSGMQMPMYLQDSLLIQILENRGTYQQKLIEIIYAEIFQFSKNKKGLRFFFLSINSHLQYCTLR